MSHGKLDPDSRTPEEDHLASAGDLSVRIHPTLDRPEVPEFYVAAVVFHEMLHQAVPVHEAGGRRVVHGREFRARERAYRDHERARAWESRHLGLLLSSPDR